MKLYKTTITIWSKFNPEDEGLELEDLARDATSGSSYCSKFNTDLMEDPTADPDWDGTEFFWDGDEE
jgi:hypothetical protein